MTTRLEQIRERFAVADSLRNRFLGSDLPLDDMSWLLKCADALAQALEHWADFDVLESGKRHMPECDRARAALHEYRTAETPCPR